MIDLLCHYTSEDGLEGIIENDNIRATHVRFLNDWTEFREAFTERYLRVLIDSFRAQLPVDLDPTARQVIDSVLSKRTGEILDIIELSDTSNETFVSSFTSATPEDSADPGDRLSQRRGYANTSQGYSLGFDKTLLQKQIGINNKKAQATLQQCIYDEHKKTSLFEEMGCTAAGQFADLKRRGEPVPSSFTTNVTNAPVEYKKASFYFLKSFASATAKFFTQAARIKHPGFSEEHEWRVIFQASTYALAPVEKAGRCIEIVKFRDGQFGRTPFIEIPLSLADAEKSPLRRIVVGPGRHKEDVKRSVDLFLLNRGIQNVEVSTSLIPYRAS
jgi:hypothetical protein